LTSQLLFDRSARVAHNLPVWAVPNFNQAQMLSRFRFDAKVGVASRRYLPVIAFSTILAVYATA
jgi:hypothetical protein